MSRKMALPALNAGVLALSLAGVCSKLASRERFLSPRFLLFYGAALLIQAAYALLWQQALRALPLTVAYACRGMSVVWAALWGAALFGEPLSPRLLLAAALVAAGVGLAVSGDG